MNKVEVEILYSQVKKICGLINIDDSCIFFDFNFQLLIEKLHQILDSDNFPLFIGLHPKIDEAISLKVKGLVVVFTFRDDFAWKAKESDEKPQPPKPQSPSWDYTRNYKAIDQMRPRPEYARKIFKRSHY